MVGQQGDPGVATYVAQPRRTGRSVTWSTPGRCRRASRSRSCSTRRATTPCRPPATSPSRCSRTRSTPDPSSSTYLTQNLSGVYTNTDPRNYELSAYSYLILPTDTSNTMNDHQGLHARRVRHLPALPRPVAGRRAGLFRAADQPGGGRLRPAAEDPRGGDSGGGPLGHRRSATTRRSPRTAPTRSPITTRSRGLRQAGRHPVPAGIPGAHRARRGHAHRVADWHWRRYHGRRHRRRHHRRNRWRRTGGGGSGGGTTGGGTTAAHRAAAPRPAAAPPPGARGGSTTGGTSPSTTGATTPGATSSAGPGRTVTRTPESAPPPAGRTRGRPARQAPPGPPSSAGTRLGIGPGSGQPASDTPITLAGSNGNGLRGDADGARGRAAVPRQRGAAAARAGRPAQPAAARDRRDSTTTTNGRETADDPAPRPPARRGLLTAAWLGQRAHRRLRAHRPGGHHRPPGPARAARRRHLQPDDRHRLDGLRASP